MARIAYLVVCGLLAFVTQALALRTFWLPVGTTDPLIVFFAWQTLAALMMTLFLLGVLPHHYHKPLSSVVIHIFVICLFLPVVGHIIFLSVIAVNLVFPAASKLADSVLVDNPKFATYLVSRVNHSGGAYLRARLTNRLGSTEDRMAAMVAVQSLPSHITDGMLRQLLADPNEEIRLLAYGIVDGAEKAIMKRIFLAQEELADSVTLAEKFNANSRLAELYWELIYQHLVEGEIHIYTLEQVMHYAHNALKYHNKNAAMWYLLGRCALLEKKPEEAQSFLRNAQLYRFPNDRLLPWLAEALFLQREYGSIAKMLAPLGSNTASPLLQPSIRYWSK